MTIASEITRLQNDKASICTAIENKGVTVGNVTLDSYAACIDAIEQGGGGQFVDVLVVGGGGSGGCSMGGGGGAGGVIYRDRIAINGANIIGIGCGGAAAISGNNGGDSNFGNLIAVGGGAGGRMNCIGNNGGSGGGAGGRTGSCFVGLSGGQPTALQGNEGGWGFGCPYCPIGAGGGGAGGPGKSISSNCNTTAPNCGGYSCGGLGIISNIDGTSKCYAGGGGGGGCCSRYQPGCFGGGRGGTGSTCGGNATTCGSGGGGGGYGSYCMPGAGGNGVVVVRYPADGTYGISNAVGGCKYLCNGYCIHCFTSSGAFVLDASKKYIGYLMVGGGGSGGCSSNCGNVSGGGGGEVLCGSIEATSNTYSIIIGKGGCNGNDGGNSCIGDIIAHGGKAGGVDVGGTSGSGNTGGNRTSCGGGGGGGAYSGGGDASTSSCIGGAGGLGLYGYGGGGGGGGYSGCSTVYDGGGRGYRCGCYATNCGGGGGGGYWGTCPGGGRNGVVDICYPADGSFGFTTATGGNSCYLCNGICVHRFTSDGTFTIVS